MPNQKINQLLRERKQKRKQLASFRRSRILKDYRRAKEEQENRQEDHKNSSTFNEGQQRQLQFYNELFKEKPEGQEKKKKAKRGIQEQPQQNPDAERLQRLKSKKKRFIKKMQHQKTDKGQPLMRNYIKYALTKLEETMQKEKIVKHSIK